MMEALVRVWLWLRFPFGLLLWPEPGAVIGRARLAAERLVPPCPDSSSCCCGCMVVALLAAIAWLVWRWVS